MEISQRTTQALYALRRTANEEHSRGRLKAYISDIVIDAEWIIRYEGVPFVWYVYDIGTHAVWVNNPERAAALRAIDQNWRDQGNWYGWSWARGEQESGEGLEPLADFAAAQAFLSREHATWQEALQRAADRAEAQAPV